MSGPNSKRTDVALTIPLRGGPASIVLTVFTRSRGICEDTEAEQRDRAKSRKGVYRVLSGGGGL
jgi:hypothetical protein